MKLYIVERWGVNQQGTVGVFSTRRNSVKMVGIS
jgi:hypothetical protein